MRTLRKVDRAQTIDVNYQLIIAKMCRSLAAAARTRRRDVRSAQIGVIFRP